MTTRRKFGLGGIAAIIAAQRAPAAFVRSVIAGRQIGWVGKTKSPLPYDAVEYLESTGTQWIDTGLWSTESTEVNCEMREGELVAGTDYNGAVTGNTINGYGHGWGYIGYSYNLAGYFYWTGGIRCDGTYVSCTMDSSRNLYLNGSIVGQSCIAGYETVQTRFTVMYVFARLVGGTITPAKLKVKSIQIKQGGVTVRNFIPVRFTNEFGQTEGAMYDRVSGQLFRNQGTGSFVIGPVKARGASGQNGGGV